MIRSLNDLIYLVGETIVGAIFILVIAFVWSFIHDQIQESKIRKWEKEKREQKEKEKNDNYTKGVYDYEIKMPEDISMKPLAVPECREEQAVDEVIFENLFDEEKEKFNFFLDSFLKNKNPKIENMINNFYDKKKYHLF